MKKLIMFLGLLACLPISALCHQSLSSPSSRLELQLPSEGSHPFFTLYDGKTKLAEVGLGMILQGDTLDFTAANKMRLRSQVSSHRYKEYLLTVSNSDIRIRFRMFDEALAFRYESVHQDSVHLIRESSSWRLPSETHIWYFERPNAWKLKSYAGTWVESTLEKMSKVVSSPVQGTPIVFQTTEGKYGFISEAALYDYSGLRLKLDDECFSADFTEGSKGFDLPPYFHSPWRVLYVGGNLNALVNQKVIRELNPEPDSLLFDDKSYIRPGKSVWRWFCKGTGTPELEQEMIRAAANLNFNYTTIDDGWNAWPEKWKTVAALAKYSRTRGVGIFLWFNSLPLQNPEDDYAYMRNVLDSVARSGAVGVKVDFMDSEAKRLIDFEMKMLEECAKRSLLVNFHGCHKSTGEYFRYPNEVTREGIRGLELNKMREGYITAAHNAALPFTRYVVGHADYTPLSFTVPGATTFAHQLATLVCFDSFVQTIAESPELLLHEPVVRPALQLIRDIPTIWDEVRVLPQSRIGKLAILAKRKGNDWYIGVLNGEDRVKFLSLDLNDFVRGNATIETYTDDMASPKVLLSMKGHRPGMLKREPSIPFRKSICTTTLPELRLAPNGGAVVVIHQH